MRPWKVLMALALLVGAFFAGQAAIEQFESFQELGRTYVTSFHMFNVVILALVAVALIEFAILVICIDESEEMPIPFSDFVRSVLFGTAGVVAIGIGWYEAKVMEGKAPPLHRGTGYNKGDVFAVLVVGVLLIIIAVYYLVRDIDGYWNDYEEPEDRLCTCSACATSRRLNAPLASHPPFGYGPFGYPVFPQTPFFGGSPFVYPIVDATPPTPDATLIVVDSLPIEDRDNDGKEYEISGYMLIIDDEIVDLEFDYDEVEAEETDEPASSDASEQS